MPGVLVPLARGTRFTHPTAAPVGHGLSLRLLGLAVLATALGGGSPVWSQSLVALPGELVLHSRELPQRLIVHEVHDGQLGRQIVDGVQWSSSNPHVVVVEEHAARAIGNGEALLTARRGDASAEVRVRVRDLDQPFSWSFRSHVESVLTKAGCNSGACHGAAAGKNGFKLSLRGYDPEGDFLFLTRQAGGRRIVLSDPGRSLLLTKPSGALPHRGGVRFSVDSREYQVLADWIAAGTPAPAATDARLANLVIMPPQVMLSVGDRQQMVVQAYFTDGRVEDVTGWVKFSASQASVADVDATGQVTVMGPGEGAITAWYLSQVANATVTVPYDHTLGADTFTAAERHNLIDQRVLAKLEQLRLAPSPPASDEVFLRRAMVDTLGVLPSAAEVEAFVADPAPDKRTHLVDTLLARPELVDYWSYRWAELLLINSERLQPAAMWSFYHWVRSHVAANTPWNQVVRELLTARGGTLENGASNFYQLHQDPLDLAETTTVAFLGMSINCARCHNHPLEKWTNDQYYAFANLFARVRTKNGERQQVVFDAEDGDLIQPLRGVPQQPTPLDGVPLAAGETTRREYLAEWITSDQNPAFARAVVNRVWANYFGRGLVESVDDMRLTNPASNEALLTELAGYLVDHGYDLRSLMRLILQSATYQRSSQTLAENAADDRFYSRYYPRRLMAEVLLDAVSQVTGAPTEFPGYPAGWRALQLPDSNVNSYFLKTFGRPERVITCECERTAEPSMVQVLHLSNGDVLNQKLARNGNRIDALMAAGSDPGQWVDQLFLTALSRKPTETERAQLLPLLTEPPEAERRAALEDLFWSVLSSKEFLFNH